MTQFVPPRSGAIRDEVARPVTNEFLGGRVPAHLCAAPALDPLNNLRVVLEACQAGGAVDGSLALWLATALETFLDHSCETLEEAFGLRNGQGGVSWRVAASMAVRDAELKSLARAHFPKLPVASQAQAIHVMCERYAATQWRFDRLSKTMPAAYRGTPKEHVWRAFQSGATMPLCTRRLRSILSASKVGEAH
jgi:hypothetical protein